MENNLLPDSKILRRRGTIAPSRNRATRNIFKAHEVCFINIYLYFKFLSVYLTQVDSAEFNVPLEQPEQNSQEENFEGQV